MVALLEQFEEALEKEKGTLKPHGKAAKVREQIRKLGAAARIQREMDRREQEIFESPVSRRQTA